ncbi:MAG: HXXEE domain-containing protein [Candidatus Thorarchaeota archaeon]
MKVFKPLVIFLVLLILVSILAGILFPVQVVEFAYSPLMYLLVCFAQAGHFLEENYTRAWEVEAQLRKHKDGTPKDPISGRDFLVLFSHVLVLLSFLFYFPIATQTPWALIYGLGISLNGILNGVVHTALLIKFKRNTGFVSGLFLLVFGILLWTSVFIPFGY